MIHFVSSATCGSSKTLLLDCTHMYVCWLHHAHMTWYLTIYERWFVKVRLYILHASTLALYIPTLKEDADGITFYLDTPHVAYKCERSRSLCCSYICTRNLSHTTATNNQPLPHIDTSMSDRLRRLKSAMNRNIKVASRLFAAADVMVWWWCSAVQLYVAARYQHQNLYINYNIGFSKKV